MFEESANNDRPAFSAAVVLDPWSALPRLEAEYPEVFRLFRLVGIHPETNSLVANLYAPKNPVGPFGNIGLHSIAVAMCVESLHARLVSLNVVPHHSRQEFVRSALLHDIAKPFEVAQRLSVANTSALGSPPADQTLFRLLLRNGWSEEDALVIVTSGVDAGHRAIHRLMYVDRFGSVRPVAGRICAKVLFLCDNMVNTNMPRPGQSHPESLLVECGQRLRSTTMRQRYPWLTEGGFVLDENFDLIEVEHIARIGPELTVIGSYLECLFSASEQIASELLPELQLPLDERRGPSNTLFDYLASVLNSANTRTQSPHAIGT
jgi:hypothetical protein